MSKELSPQTMELIEKKSVKEMLSTYGRQFYQRGMIAALTNPAILESIKCGEQETKVNQCLIYDSLNAFADIGDKMTIHRKDFNKAAKLASLAIADYTKP